MERTFFRVRTVWCYKCEEEVMIVEELLPKNTSKRPTESR